MKKQTLHSYPNEQLYRLKQMAWAALLLLMLAAAVLVLILAFVIPAPLFVPGSVLIVLLSGFVVMQLVISPPVTISDKGLTLHPLFGREQFVGWEQVEKVVMYPLLPAEHQEVVRRLIVGKKRYRSAEGIMLIVPELPLPYRIGGILSGEGGAPVIALTNRTHSDYGRLLERVRRHTGYKSEIKGT